MPMPAGRGFDKARVIADIPNSLPGGSTAMVRASIAAGTSCGRCRTASSRACASSCSSPTARPTAFPASTPGRAGPVEGLENVRTFPTTAPDPDNQTHRQPDDRRPLRHGHGSRESPVSIVPSTSCCASELLVQRTDDRRRAVAAPDQRPFVPPKRRASRRSFPLQTNTLTVDGAPQNAAPRLRNFNARADRYPADIFNINNAARNLVEIIAQRRARRHGWRLPDPHLHDRHGRARAATSLARGRRRRRACSSASPTT